MGEVSQESEEVHDWGARAGLSWGEADRPGCPGAAVLLG